MGKIRARWATSTTGLAGLAFAGALAVAQASAAESNPRLNGFWNIDAEYRFNALAKVHAELTPAGQEIAKRNAAVQADRLAHGEPVGLGSYTCGKQGVPFIVGTSEPFLLTLTKDEVVQYAERRQMRPRHIYMDGRDWSDLSKLPPSISGYSIGHWEGKDLVVETRGMPSGGIDGRGLKGPNTVLIERAHVTDDGEHLMWTYTWTDPGLLAKPVVLELKYDRAPPQTYAYTHNCDPNEGAGNTVTKPIAD